MNTIQKDILRSLPAMDELLEHEKIRPFSLEIGRDTVKFFLGRIMERIRKDVLSGELEEVDMELILRRADSELSPVCKKSLRRVINATGVVVHTNLGRSCLSDDAVDAVKEVASGYSTLEYDLAAGRRGQRNTHVEWLLCQLTGAEAALVVNNNAGAVMLSLAALAKDREVIVSRGELVEIGGSFRVPEIMAFSGAHMVEVGATNRTHLKDYEGAFTERTAMFLKVHPSNFRIEGFSSAVPREELARASREKGVIFMEDLGSGILIDVSHFDLSGEPTVRDCIGSGVDLVTFSGDKMLGGPQIGGIVGRKDLVDRLRKYPLLRALRVDKMTLAALETTLRMYLKGEWRKIPTLSMLSLSMDDMKKKASSLARRLRKIIPDSRISVVEVEDAVGGGAFPATVLKGVGISIKDHPWGSAGNLQVMLRSGDIPVVIGAGDDSALIHVRTLSQEDEKMLLKAFAHLVDKRGVRN